MSELPLLISEQESESVSADQFEANSSFVMYLRYMA